MIDVSEIVKAIVVPAQYANGLSRKDLYRQALALKEQV